MSHVTCRMWHVTCLMSNAYVDPWDMLNNFCFQVYAQKWVLVIMSHVTCHILHVTCHMSHCACHMSYIKCLCWFLGHAEQLLFWSLCSKVSICNYVTCHMLHVTCRMSHVTCLMSNAYVDPWDMLNNFCFHVYAQMSLFMGENDNVFFLQPHPHPLVDQS